MEYAQNAARWSDITIMTSSNGNIFRVTGPLWGNSPHKGQWRGALMLSLICAWINGWVNNGEAGNLKRHRVHYDVTVVTQERYPITRTQLCGSLCVVCTSYFFNNLPYYVSDFTENVPVNKRSSWFRWHVANKTDDKALSKTAMVQFSNTYMLQELMLGITVWSTGHLRIHNEAKTKWPSFCKLRL